MSGPDRGASEPAKIRRYREGDEDQIVEVVGTGFGGWPWFQLSVPAVEHLAWRLEGPKPNKDRHWLAVLDSRIVSVVVETELDVKVRGTTCSLSIQGAVATLPAYQGRGIFSQLYKYRLEHQRPFYDFTLTISANPIVLRQWERDPTPRLQMTNEIRTLIKVLDVRRAALIHDQAGGRLQRNLLVRLVTFLGFKLIGSVHGWRSGVQQSWTITRITAFDERIDDFWQEASTAFEFIFERKQDFLNWRYCDSRGGNHAVFLAEQDGRILGYIALRLSSATRAQILDVLALPERNDVVDTLLASAVEFLRESGIAAIQCWMPSSHPYNEILKQHGLVDSRRRVKFGWWLKPGVNHDRFDFLREPNAAIHVMEGEMLD